MGIAPVNDRIEYVRKVLNVPPHLTPFALVACGYPVREKVQQDRYDESRVHYIM